MRPIPTEPMLDNCAKCGRETRHTPDADGTYHCAVCAESARQAARAAYRAKNAKQWKQVLMWLVPSIGLLCVAAGVQRCSSDSGSAGSSEFERCKARQLKLANDTLTEYDRAAVERYCEGAR